MPKHGKGDAGKPLYESPKVMNLDASDKALGDCISMGSGDETCFQSGSSALFVCDGNGSSAGACKGAGSSPES